MVGIWHPSLTFLFLMGSSTLMEVGLDYDKAGGIGRMLVGIIDYISNYWSDY